MKANKAFKKWQFLNPEAKRKPIKRVKKDESK